MRHWLLLAAAGLLPGLWLVESTASELKGTPTGPPGAVKKVVKSKPAEVCTDDSCGSFGTSVVFAKSPSDAAKQAQKEEKLVFVLHVSGDFENPDFTWNNAEALRVNALANPAVGKYINEYFVSGYQRVGTFRIVGKQKQGGNVAAYFCAPDGRVLHCVAGPVDANTMLREAKWVVETTQAAMKEPKADGTSFKAYFRKAHAQKLRSEHGLAVEPITFDPPVAQDPSSPLTYRDPSGRPLAPILQPVPINGPDVHFELAQKNAAHAPGAAAVRDLRGRGWVLGNQGRVHQLMSAHCMAKIENVYASIFEGILGERVTTQPVQVVNPFPNWNRGGINHLPNGGGLRPQVLPNGALTR